MTLILQVRRCRRCRVELRRTKRLGRWPLYCSACAPVAAAQKNARRYTRLRDEGRCTVCTAVTGGPARCGACKARLETQRGEAT